MTQRPLILDNNQDPWELIDTPWGEMEAWRASTLATGTMGALAQVAAIVRSDAAELQEKTVAFDAKKASVLRTVNKLLSFMSRVDALTTRVEALEAQRKADMAAQQKLDEEPIELPPDFLRPQDLPPAKIGDDTPSPSGELHALGPSQEPEPALEIEDQTGDLPEELKEDLPELPPEPRGTVYPQPVSISLNEA